MRREGCIRRERCTHQALPEGKLPEVCLKPVAKGKVGAVLLPSCSPSGCCSELAYTVSRADQGTMAYCHMVSTSSASAWEMVVKSSWSGLDTCLRGLATAFLLTPLGWSPPAPAPICGSLHHHPRQVFCKCTTGL